MAFFTRVQKKLQDKFGSVCYNKTHKKFSKEEARLRNFFRRQPCRKDMNNIEWFREAKYGMMVHFGLYSMLAGEYRGRRTPYDYGEWIQSALPSQTAKWNSLRVRSTLFILMRRSG